MLNKMLLKNYEDVFWSEDALVLERNSRDFVERMEKMSANAEALVDFLRSRAICAQPVGGRTLQNPGRLVIKDVFYPKYLRKDLYDACRRGSPQHVARSVAAGKKPAFGLGTKEGGYSMLFSITFIDDNAAATFHDNLKVCKGPGLGTNFTLVCPFTIVAYQHDMEWAVSHGIERELVRVSAGLEDTSLLLSLFKDALDKTESSRL